MLLANEWGVGQMLWSILWFFLFVMWIWLVISIFADIMRAQDLSGWAKALWTLLIILLPFFGVFIYLIVNGNKMNQRAARAVQEQDEAMQAYIRQAAGSGGGGGTAAELSRLAELHSNGTLSDDEYNAAKAKVLSG